MIILADGIFTDTSPSQMNNNNDNDDEDDAEYWFDSADPKRPQIEAQNSKSAYSNQRRRIFHKLAPQVQSWINSCNKQNQRPLSVFLPTVYLLRR